MNLLAVETSTELCSVALLRGGELFVEEALAENRHSELLAPLVRKVLERAHLSAAHMDAFGFGQGPGSFTGIRIACGMTQGLAYAAHRPVVPVPSLLALARWTIALANDISATCAGNGRTCSLCGAHNGMSRGITEL